MNTKKDIEVCLLKALRDNYIYLIYNHGPNHEKNYNISKEVWVVDPGEAKPVQIALKEQRLHLKGIINTHHHFDHTGGNRELKEAFSCPIYAPLKGKSKIKEADYWLEEGGTLELFKGIQAKILEVPGHTLDHVALYLDSPPSLFVGDTLFSLGCGFLFEGSPKQMWKSLQRLRKFPDTTHIYCGHEYTLSNARFAKHIEPKNKALQELYLELSLQRQRGEPTLPTTLAKEKRFNPFLRCDEPQFKSQLGLNALSDDEVFACLREQKNNFNQ